jgi:N-acetyl-alpha-D-muramate 1-phosphate uridylyltransferase
MRTGEKAMVLAAGYGQRMRPLTLTRPKPLVEVAGKTLIDYGFERLRAANVETAVVNVHYLPDQIEAWAARQAAPRIIISDERGEILDTGGGIAKALPLLGKSPSSSSTATASGWMRASPHLIACAPHGTMTRWIASCCSPHLRAPSAMTDRAISCAMRRAGSRGVQQAEGAPLVYSGAYLVSPRLFAERRKANSP